MPTAQLKATAGSAPADTQTTSLAIHREFQVVNARAFGAGRFGTACFGTELPAEVRQIKESYSQAFA